MLELEIEVSSYALGNGRLVKCRIIEKKQLKNKRIAGKWVKNKS